MIRNWILGGAGNIQPDLSNFNPVLVLDDGICRTRTKASEMIAQRAPFVDVILVTECIAESSLCIVTDGTDPVTNMRHRVAWVFESEAGTICRIILTRSGQIPDKPYDGRLPLRPVSD